MLLPAGIRVHIILVLSLFVGEVSASVGNEYRRTMTINCGRNEHLAQISSTYSTTHRDRKWTYVCRPTPANIKNGLTCALTSFVNYYDDEFQKVCPGSSFLNGLYSIYREGFVDRRYRARCCFFDRLRPCNCFDTPYLNSYQEAFSYDVPSNRFITGIRSQYSLRYRDRTFSFKICQLA
ncbi:dermatopontin-like [Pecten maximus]|uniref:dermatopontin-like n=1 Tax=Pecten maximus TaxID=6579 RepID=UPI0014588A75|nr:dermatopontin-like [Pecten maximus]